MAWNLFSKDKRRRNDVITFEQKLEDNIFEIHDELVSGRYRHSQYTKFTIHDPKQRTIHKALVRDRVVHQAIINVIEPLFEKRFVFDSYSCRKRKGTHTAVKRLQSFLRQVSENDTKTVYVVKCDVRKFFASINHEILLKLITQYVVEPRVITLLNGIIRSFSTVPGVGIPLGNLTSQLFANIYLHELDWFVKQKLHIKYYIRYCDDFAILASSISEGMNFAKKIDLFLRGNLKIQLHPNKVYVRTWTQGIDFLGYVILPHAVLVRPTTAKRAAYRATKENITSYFGLCSHANAYEISRTILNKIGAGSKW